MESVNTVQGDTGHTDLHAVSATRALTAQKDSISTAITTIPEHIQTQKAIKSSEIELHSEGDIGLSEGLELHKPPDSPKQETTECPILETSQAHVSHEVDFYVDDLKEYDENHTVILDVSR
jgi:hypothetical protein